MPDQPPVTNGTQPNAAQRAINYVVLWKIALFKLLVRCTITASTFYLGAMANEHWSELDGDSRFKLMLGMGVNVLTLVSTFIDKSEKNLSTGDLTPPDIGDSANGGAQTWTRKQVTDTTTTSQSNPPPPISAPTAPPAAPTQPQGQPAAASSPIVKP